MRCTVSCALYLLPLALIAGCATTPPPTPLPYHFTLAQVADARPAPADGGTDPIYDALPFSAQDIALGMVRHLPYSVYGAREAKLYLKVTHYQATSDDNGSYALSIGMEGYAMDDSSTPRRMGQFSASCNQVQREGFALDAMATDMYREKSLRPLTPAGRDSRMWREVMDGCTRELARQFAANLAAKGE